MLSFIVVMQAGAILFVTVVYVGDGPGGVVGKWPQGVNNSSAADCHLTISMVKFMRRSMYHAGTPTPGLITG